MNDEYLWQKTGEDPEIEKLEQKLAMFRYREIPLRLPSTETAVEIAARPRWRLSLTFGFAASAMAALLVAVMLIAIIDNEPETVFVASPELELPSVPAAVTDEKKLAPTPAPAPSMKVVPQFARSKRGSNIHNQTDTERRQKTKDITSNSSVAALTPEERYAYRQLMLALSISSSKLKIVRDTIDGKVNTEDPGNYQR